MNTDIPEDPVADLQLRVALESAAGEAPVADVDWEALRTAIRSDAGLPLARRRRESRRPFLGWGRVALPALCAAALAALLLRGDILKPPQPELQATSLRPMAEQVLGSSISESEWELLLSQQVETEALLLAAVGATDAASP